jgi:tRNA A37 threonylcarbamoyladenosine biosynthesis protein TsaE
MQYAQEWEEMGFDEYLTAQSKAWCLIEWPDKVFSLNLNDSNSVANLIINFESTNNGLQRVLTIQTI